MQIKEINVSEIKEYAKNAKKHPEKQVVAIATSIKKFGFRQPLVLDKGMEVIIGHGRLAAAKMLHMKTVPCVMADDLTEEQIKALRIADNKTNESEWDFNLLGEELAQLVDIDMTDLGFNEAEILELTIDDSPAEIPTQLIGETPTASQSPQEDFAGEFKDDNTEAYEGYAYQHENPVGEISRNELEEYESHADAMVTRRVIIVFRTDEEEAFVRNLLKVQEGEKLKVIYLAEKMMEH